MSAGWMRWIGNCIHGQLDQSQVSTAKIDSGESYQGRMISGLWMTTIFPSCERDSVFFLAATGTDTHPYSNFSNSPSQSFSSHHFYRKETQASLIGQ